VESSVVQIIIASTSVLVAAFGMLQRRYALEIKLLEKKHRDELKIVSDHKAIERAHNFSNLTSLKRLESNKADIFSRISQLEGEMTRLQGIIPRVEKLLGMVLHHFESRAEKLKSTVKEIAPNTDRVSEKKE